VCWWIHLHPTIREATISCQPAQCLPFEPPALLKCAPHTRPKVKLNYLLWCQLPAPALKQQSVPLHSQRRIWIIFSNIFSRPCTFKPWTPILQICPPVVTQLGWHHKFPLNWDAWPWHWLVSEDAKPKWVCSPISITPSFPYYSIKNPEKYTITKTTTNQSVMTTLKHKKDRKITSQTQTTTQGTALLPMAHWSQVCHIPFLICMTNQSHTTWGHILPSKTPSMIQLILQNVGRLDLHPSGSVKLAVLHHFMSDHQVDIATLTKCNVAWNKVDYLLHPPTQTKFWWEMVHWVLSHNCQDLHAASYQLRGVGIVVTN